MQIAKQIKKYRLESKLSQEELADKVYVTRQTISNWENNKSYPDIKSLLLLSDLFDVSLDILVKGDLEEMKKQVKTEDVKKLKHDSAIFVILMICTIACVAQLFLYLNLVGIILWIILAGITMYYGIRIEKYKKNYEIRTYQEILAFIEGRVVDE